MRRFAAVIPLLAVVAVLVPATSASAAAKVGVGDNSPQIFTDPLYRALNSKITRLIVPIDTVANGGPDLAQLDAYMIGAGLTGTEVLVTFNYTRDHAQRFNTSRDLPSVKAYEKHFKAFRARYPKQKLYSPWNEINHFSQPTFRNPKRAAQFSNSANKLCRGCKIVAGDFLDQLGLEKKFFPTFRKNLNFKPKYWGLHNYSDTNRFRNKGTKAFLKMTKTGEVWLTETGGVVQLCPNNCSFNYDEARAKRAIDFMFKLANSSKRIKRLYTYAFYGAPRTARFDAGVVGPDGKPRPGYFALKAKMNP